MAIDYTKINEALKAGYSHADILDILAEQDSKIAEARSAGFSDQDIFSVLGESAPAPAKERSVFDGLKDIVTNIGRGAQGTARSASAMGNTVVGDLSDVELISKANQAAQSGIPAEQQSLMAEIQRRKSANPDAGIWQAVTDVGSAALDNKMGTAQLIAEQAPNSAVALGGGWAGAKAGALAGSTLGPVGAVAGGTLGFLGGMFLGNYLLEGGGKAMEKAQDGFTSQDRTDTLIEGADKAAVITGVDALTFKLGSVAAKALNRTAIEAGARAEARVLMDAGVNAADPTELAARLATNPDLFKAAKTAGEAAAKEASTLAARSMQAGTGLAMETVGEGTGEYFGELATTGKADPYDAALEAISSFGQSSVETAYNVTQAQGNEMAMKGILQAGSTDEAVAYFNELTAAKVAPLDAATADLNSTITNFRDATGQVDPPSLAEQEIITPRSGTGINDGTVLTELPPAPIQTPSLEIPGQVTPNPDAAIAGGEREITPVIRTAAEQMLAMDPVAREKALGYYDQRTRVAVEEAMAQISGPAPDLAVETAARPFTPDLTPTVPRALNEIRDATATADAAQTEITSTGGVRYSTPKVIAGRPAESYSEAELANLAQTATSPQTRHAASAALASRTTANDLLNLDGTTTNGPQADQAVQAEVQPVQQAAPQSTLPEGTREQGANTLPLLITTNVKVRRATANAMQAIGRFTGTKVKFFFNKNAEGIYRPGNNEVWINTAVGGNTMRRVFGHEVTHQLRTNHPVAWKAIETAVTAGLKTDGLTSMYRDYFGNNEKLIKLLDDAIAPEDIEAVMAMSGKEAGYGERTDSVKDILMDELVSDLGGNRFGETQFWDQVFDNILQTEGSEKGRTVIQKLKDAMTKLLKQLELLVKQRGFNADEFIAPEQMEKVRTAMAEAYAKAINAARTRSDVGADVDSTFDAPVDAATMDGKEATVRQGRIRRSVDELVKAAESQSDWKTWYARHEDTLINIFAEDADLFQQILSATSQATGVKGNVTLALKAYDQLLSGKEFEGYLPAVIKNLQRIRDSEKLRGAKISQYGEANDGNTEAIAVDRHIAMLFFNTKTPTARQIESAKGRIRVIANRLGWEPRQVQAALWAYNQVRLGTDPSKVESYDKILEARRDAITELRSKLGRGEAGGAGFDGRTGRGTEAGQAGYGFAKGETTQLEGTTLQSALKFSQEVRSLDKEQAIKFAEARADQLVDPNLVPDFNFADHVGRSIFATIADRTIAGGEFTGIDGATTTPIPQQGGPGFPFLSRNWWKEVLWASKGKAIVSKKANLISKHGRPLMAVSLGALEMHSSNDTVMLAYLKTLEAYINAGRVNPDDLVGVTEQIQKLKLKNKKNHNVDELSKFPGFADTKALDAFFAGASFKARAAIIEELGKARSETLNLPSSDKLVRKMLDPEYAGNRHFDTVLILEPHDEDTFVKLGEEGTDPHLSYTYGVRGKVVGKLKTAVNAREIWADWYRAKFKEKWAEKEIMAQIYNGKATIADLEATVDREDYEDAGKWKEAKKNLVGQYEGIVKNPAKLKTLLSGDYTSMISLDRSFSMAMPAIEITPQMATRLDRLANGPSVNEATTKAVLDFIDGNWSQTDETTGNGVSQADFARELRNSDYSATLTQYSEDELTEASRGWKWGEAPNAKGVMKKVKVAVDRMKLFKLGDHRIQFALKYGKPDLYDQKSLPGVTDNEVTLVSVVNNTPGVKGIAGPAIMTKAIEEGATFLDCYEVISPDFPNGFLPDLYAEYGFEKVGVQKFDPKFFTPDHAYAWKQFGWKDGDPLPNIVFMKWKGKESDRAGTVQRYIEEGAGSLWGKTTRGIGTATAKHAGSNARQKAGQDAGRADTGSGDQGVQTPGNRGTLASRAYSTIKQVQGLNAEQLGNLGIERYSESRPDGASNLGAGSEFAGPTEEGQLGAVSATGIHYSKGERKALVSSFFGSGTNSAELERIKQSDDKRIKHRIYFYVNTGRGINQEFGVGPHAHKADLSNLYDVYNDPIDLKVGRDANELESAILDSGFDGYLDQQSGIAVLLGQRAIPVEYLGGNNLKPTVDRAGQATPSNYQAQLRAIQANKSLPGGEMLGSDWKRMMPRLMPEIDVSHLEDDKKYYKAGVVRKPEANPDIRYSTPRSGPWYYSQLEEGIKSAPAKLSSMPAAQWKVWLIGNASKLGVKKDELQWSGVLDYLDMLGKAKVTKDDLAQWVAENGVKVEEVVLGDTPDAEAAGRALAESQGNVWEDIGQANQERYIRRAAGNAINEDVAGRPKFASYVLPGGENYKELLITLPPKNKPRAVADNRRKFDNSGLYVQMEEYLIEELQRARRERGDSFATQSEFESIMSDPWAYADMVDFEPKFGISLRDVVVDHGARKIRTSNLEYGDETDHIEAVRKENEAVAKFMSSHFDQPNILAHIRMNERTDAEGNRVLFIEEIQSDWGQKGKKEGFAGDEWADLRDPVPTAPFVTDTKSWTSLALKRAIAYAVDHGFDKIAWTTGEQQAARYDLSKQVSAIEYRDGNKSFGDENIPAGSYSIHIVKSDGSSGGTKILRENELEDYVGKDVAEKIINDAGTKEGALLYRHKVLSGLDLKVGGEGMKGFYDAIVPQVAKKLGAEVGVVEIPGQAQGFVIQGAPRKSDPVMEQPGFTISDTMKEQASSKGMMLFSPPRNLQGQPINQSWQDGSFMGRWDEFTRSMQDKLIDTKRVMAEIRKTIANIREDFDPYLQEMLYHGRSAKRVADFADNELKPLLTDMAMRQIEMQEFEDYLWAKHAGERNAQIAKINPNMPDGGSGLTNAEASQILSGQAVIKNGRTIQLRPAKMTGYVSLAARVKAINNATLQALVDGGLETQQTVDTWKNTYGDYVPLKRDMESDDNYAGAFGLGQGTGQGFSVKGSSSKRALGSERGVIDILANVAMQRERAITRAEKNKVAMATYGLALTAPNPDFWIAINPDAADTAKLQQELIAMGLSPLDAQNIAREPKQRYTDPKTGLVTERINPQLRNRGDVVAVRVNGLDRFVMFSSNDRAQAMVAGLKNLDAEQLGWFYNNVGVATRWFSSINTQYNPVFGLTNGIRDLGAGALNLSSTALAGQQGKVTKDAFSALRGIYADLRDHRAGRQPTSVWALEFEEFQKEGGQTGYKDMFSDSQERAKAIQKEIDAASRTGFKAAAFNTGGAVFGWLEDYNTAIENAVRLSAYKNAKDMGMSKQQAAALAKNLTVNFNKKGNVSSQVGSLFAFFNAAVQGTARIGETMVKDGKLSSVGQKIVYGGLLAGVMQGVMAAMAGWDDEEPPQFAREKNFIIPLPDGKYLSVPYPLGFHVIPNMGRIMTEFALGGFRDPAKRITSVASVIMDAFNPLGSASMSQMVTPTVLDPVIAMSENKDFTGKSIYKEDFNKMKPTAGWTRTKDTASDFGKVLSYGLNYASGGGKYQIGILSPTPDQLDYIVGQVTGGVGRETLKLWQAGKTPITGEELPMYKVPVAGRFIGETTGQASATSKFYNNLKRIGEHAGVIKEMEDAKDYEAKREYLVENPDAKLVDQADKASRELGYLKRQKRDALEKGDKEKVKRIEDTITTKVNLWNSKLRRKEENQAG